MKNMAPRHKAVFSSRKIWLMYLQVGFLGLIIAATLWYAMNTASRITKHYSPLIDAAMEIKLEAATAHLWLEEFINGDRNVDINEVWKNINQAEWYAQAMLTGGHNDKATYIPLNDPELRQEILEVLEKIKTFRNIAKERFANIDQSSVGSDIDQRFDAIFTSFLKQADNVDVALRQAIHRNLQQFHSIQTALIVLCFLLTSIIVVILHRFERKQSINFAMLKSANQQLMASEQQLKASNQQLMASEQQLRASNQQLRASEQQLKATNQRLGVSEQQLKATNQQLRASEQQLKASNQQLKKSQQKLALHVKQTPLGVIQWDLDFKVTEWNQSAEKIFGFTSKEAIDRHAAGLIVPGSEKDAVDKVWRDLLAQKGGTRSTNNNITKHNKSIICEWYNTPLVDDNGDVIGVASLIMDVTERKINQEKLQQSNERFTLFMNHMPGVAFVKDAQGKYVYANDKMCCMVDKALENVLGATDQELFPPELAAQLSQNDELVRSDGRPITVEESGIMQGQESHYVTSKFPFQMSDGEMSGVAGVGIDITERKQAEGRLKDSERKSRAWLENSTVCTKVVDLDFNLQFMSTAGVEALLIDDITQFYGKPYPFDFYPDSFRKPMISNLQKAKETGETIIQEASVVDIEGKELWFHSTIVPVNDDGGRLDYIMILSIDTTERKQAEQNMHDLAHIVEKSLNEIYIFDAESFKFIQVNYGARENIGYTQKELLQLTPLDIKPGFTVQSFMQLVEPLRNGTKEIITFDTVHQRKDGSLYDVEVHLQLSEFLDKSVFVAIILDVTETKRLQKLEARAARLETAGTIAGQVAHDFNNLLAPIIAYPEFIHDELPPNHKAHAYLDDIESAAKMIADINQDLLTMGRRGYYNLEVLDLNRVVLQAIQELEPQAKKVTFELKLSESLMNIKGGEAQIHRMLSNLLVNAQDAIGTAGQIIIKTENYYADDTSVAFGRVPKGEYVKLTVTDNGCGIPDSIIQNILDPFFSTKSANNRSGSGLGLSVVDAVMKDHSGHLDLTSKVGQGTSFYLYFPITRENAQEDDSVQLTGGTETVLVVDDDTIQREVSSKLLSKLGYQINSVASGEKAIEFLSKHPQDIIILDMVMPDGIDGAETYQRMLEINPNQKAIILSGFSESKQVLKVQKLGAGAFVRKPVTKRVIALAIRKELDRKVENYQNK